MFNDAAEKSVLCSILIENTAIEEIELKEDDFYSSDGRKVFGAIKSLYDEGKVADKTTLLAKLGDEYKDYLQEVAFYVGSASNIKEYAGIVKELSLRRNFEKTLDELKFMSGDSEEIGSVIDDAQKRMMELTEEASVKAPVRADVAASKYVSLLLERAKTHYRGVASGYKGLDAMTGGFKEGELIILAARPAMGKTALAMNFSACAARQGNVLVFSLEMSEEQLMNRLFTSELYVCDNANLPEIKRERDSHKYWGSIDRARELVSKLRLHIYDDSRVTVSNIRRVARQVRHRYGPLKLLVIDYLQLMNSERKYDSRVQEVSDLTRSLKILARELEVPIIVLSQLSRGVEGRNDKRPMMSDLRESGSIEQDADIIMFLYREGYYNKESLNPWETELILAKHRGGPIGTVKLCFENEVVTFEDATPDEVEEEDDDDEED